jgi:hypothetical protein
MARVHLIHWKGEEALQRAAELRAAGYEAQFVSLDGVVALREIGADPPHAVLIDLGRAPSHGRDVGVALRSRKATRQVPLVFVGGAPDKVAQIRELLPDAAFTKWQGLAATLKRALANPPEVPVVPASLLAGYAGAPLPKKLGIGPGSVVALVGAPKGFARTLGNLPEGVTLRNRVGRACDVTVWFTTSRRELERRVARMGAMAEKGSLWIAWPKKTSPIRSDLSQTVVRRVGLAAGLVDYKIAALDANWSGLRFTRRKARRFRPGRPDRGAIERD